MFQKTAQTLHEVGAGVHDGGVFHADHGLAFGINLLADMGEGGKRRRAGNGQKRVLILRVVAVMVVELARATAFGKSERHLRGGGFQAALGAEILLVGIRRRVGFLQHMVKRVFESQRGLLQRLSRVHGRGARTSSRLIFCSVRANRSVHKVTLPSAVYVTQHYSTMRPSCLQKPPISLAALAMALIFTGFAGTSAQAAGIVNLTERPQTLTILFANDEERQVTIAPGRKWESMAYPLHLKRAHHRMELEFNADYAIWPDGTVTVQSRRRGIRHGN